MKNLLRLLLVPTLAALLLGLAFTPSNAVRRAGGSAYDGTWSVAIYTQRGACASVRVAVRIVGGRVYSEDQSYQSNGSVSANGVVPGERCRGWPIRIGLRQAIAQFRRWSMEVVSGCSGTWLAVRR
jgi:hypothetical protein